MPGAKEIFKSMSGTKTYWAYSIKKIDLDFHSKNELSDFMDILWIKIPASKLSSTTSVVEQKIIVKLIMIWHMSKILYVK